MTPNRHSAFERKIATLLIGVSAVMYGLMPLLDKSTASGFMRYTTALGYGPSWYVMLVSAGVLMCLGALLPCRSLRHIGLVLGSFVNGAVALELLINGRLLPVTFQFFLFSAVGLWLFSDDVARKRRDAK